MWRASNAHHCLANGGHGTLRRGKLMASCFFHKEHYNSCSLSAFPCIIILVYVCDRKSVSLQYVDTVHICSHQRYYIESTGCTAAFFFEFEATLLPILFCHRQYQSTEMCVRLHSNYTTRVAENTVRAVYCSHAPPWVKRTRFSAKSTSITKATAKHYNTTTHQH